MSITGDPSFEPTFGKNYEWQSYSDKTSPTISHNCMREKLRGYFWNYRESQSLLPGELLDGAKDNTGIVDLVGKHGSFGEYNVVIDRSPYRAVGRSHTAMAMSEKNLICVTSDVAEPLPHAFKHVNRETKLYSVAKNSNIMKEDTCEWCRDHLEGRLTPVSVARYEFVEHQANPDNADSGSNHGQLYHLVDTLVTNEKTRDIAKTLIDTLYQ
jgi:hypothetical protein